ncbi:MAG: DRTGG domain-containing protein [Bacteroidales bacterium]|jgi:predicted transcriptional regulator
MTVREIVESLHLKVFTGDQGLDSPVEGGYTSDLLSDVMGYADAGRIWITLQTHKNIMAIASLKELAAVLLVKGFEPDEDTKALAGKEGIPILGTTEQAFEISGRLYGLFNP